MSDIFISYTNEDRAKAKVLADALERQGWTVWWDRIIPAGRTFDEVIEEALDAAKTVIVLWSEKSVKSRWVRTEAQEGADRKIIIPVLIEKVRIPLAFRRIQAADLIGWDGSYTASSFQGLVGDIAALLGPPPKEHEKRQQAEAEARRKEEDKRKQAEAEARRKDLGASEQIEIKPASEAALPTNLLKNLPPLFYNPFELNADYIRIPAGSFKYSVTKKTEQVPDIYFAKYPVTNKRYRLFIRYLSDQDPELQKILPLYRFRTLLAEFALPHKGFTDYLGSDKTKWPNMLRSSEDEDRRFGGDDQPVVSITWFAARAYCLWLTELTRADANSSASQATAFFRLPKEVEWEWAAGGGTRTYPWGNQPSDDTRANYNNNVGHTTPVQSYDRGKTPEGLMDMAGNVWEWMGNWHEKYKGKHRSLRGGSWDADELYLRCTVRNFYYPDYRYLNLGFRVVRSRS